MTSYQQETLQDKWPEVYPLNLENNDETNLFHEPLELDFEHMKQMEDAGALKLFTIRKDGVLVGYCLFYLYFHNHHKSMLTANQDVIFIKNGSRGHASRFVQYCDGELKKLGVKAVLQHSPAMKDWSPVLKRIGYTELETTYLRRL
jgi:hypothetical protein